MSVNLHRPEFDQIRDRPGFRVRRAFLGRQLGTDKLGVSLWEVPPGEAAYPYHAHLGADELLVVLEGSPSLRTAEGWRELERGDVLSFLTGEDGAHQLVNRTDAAVRFLAVSSQDGPDIVLYPDAGTVGVSERRPDGSGFYGMFRETDTVGYAQAETPHT
ncbi:MAG TPA: cupin domain-containing protein [Solirubrobacteraceae bacterium]|nr:cupin domain-containing protein [Solirubrobacteraceae bacterium]